MGIALKKDFLFFFFLALQILLWTHTKSIKPDMNVLPELQSEIAVKASSFGDEQFYFRTTGFEIQNAGDTFGRVTPLKDYDYSALEKWFFLLDSLDNESNFTPSMAAYYYSNTQYEPDLKYIVNYLDKHADTNPSKKWWWYAQAVYNAQHKLGDKRRALDIAYKLAAVPADVNMPLWARQLAAFIHEDLGEKEEALVIIRDILENVDDIPEGELNFMHYFIKDRLDKIESNELK